MILTGTEIEKEWRNGRIVIDPFTPEQVNPNSYNFRLGRRLRIYSRMPLDPREANAFEEIDIPDDGYLLEPGRLYLAHTEECLGGDYYAPTFAARSSIARLGLFINLSASLGDIGYAGQWTLQLYTMNRVRVYPGMNIGQMMWWRPQGEIVPYSGKYQGSSGPRSSDIHLDFAQQIARQRLPALGSQARVDEVGHKFAALSDHSRAYSVPRAFAVPVTEYERALSDEQRIRLTDICDELRATVGAFYVEALERMTAVAQAIAVPDALRGLLETRIADVFGDCDSVELAVRSSGVQEDGADSSLAGVHHSVLGVRGLEGVVQAVEQCWRSYYDPAAIAARVRAGDFDSAPRLALIVQELVHPHLAGIAVTGGSHGVTLEYVDGLADGLAAGVASPRRATADELHGRTDPDAGVLGEVAAMASALAGTSGHDVDVEWAADAHGVHLIQCRPLVVAVDAEHERVARLPYMDVHDLYDATLPPDFMLDRVADIYRSYVAKRAPAYRLLYDLDIEVGRGWVIRFNGRGLHDWESAQALGAAMAAVASEHCVVDLGENLRQLVVPKAALARNLAIAAGVASDGAELHTAIVRGFVRGELGVISRLTPQGLLVEYTPDGLLALNRGIADAQCLLIGGEDRADNLENVTLPGRGAAVLPHLKAIATATERMTDRFGPVALEWVLAGGRPYVVDYSPTCSGGVVDGSDQVELSHGAAHGPLLRLDDDETLTRLSVGPAVSINKVRDVTDHAYISRVLKAIRSMDVKPIVFARRPYAVLSVFIADVAGFVFERGSVLCHLAILLREAGVPAVAAPGLDGQGDVVIAAGKVTMIDGIPGPS